MFYASMALALPPMLAVQIHLSNLYYKFFEADILFDPSDSAIWRSPSTIRRTRSIGIMIVFRPIGLAVSMLPLLGIDFAWWAAMHGTDCPLKQQIRPLI